MPEVKEDRGPSDLGLHRIYHDLAPWYPLLTPVEDYAEEAAFYLRVFREQCDRPPASLLDLGSGAGHNAHYLEADLDATLVDLSEDMLALSRQLNPDCEHLQGDMRSVRLGRTFDCVLVHDAVCHMTTRRDLAAAMETAAIHTAPGGVVLFAPDMVAETFSPGTEIGGVDRGGRGLRYLQWTSDPDPEDDMYRVDMAYMLRAEDGRVQVVHEHSDMGLFGRLVWLDQIAAAGLTPQALPFVRSAYPDGDHEVFIGKRGQSA